MTALDDKLVPVAKDLIARFGTAATVDVIARVYDPETRSTTDTTTSYGVLMTPPAPYSRRLIDGDSILSSDAQSFLAADGLSFTPATDQRVTVGGGKWTVTGVREHRTGDKVAVYELQLRR